MPLQGFQLILVARNSDKLAALEQELKSLPDSSSIHTVTLDLGQPTHAGWKTLQDEVSTLPVGILINNAGVAHSSTKFDELPLETALNIQEVNTAALMRVS